MEAELASCQTVDKSKINLPRVLGVKSYNKNFQVIFKGIVNIKKIVF